jgi:hypothetical protein
MKVKLLKKIRRRYLITHYPNGVYLYGDFVKGPVTLLEDREDSWRWKMSDRVKEQAYKQLYDILIRWIEQDYGPFKSNKTKITSEQLWYKK